MSLVFAAEPEVSVNAMKISDSGRHDTLRQNTCNQFHSGYEYDGKRFSLTFRM